MAAQSRIAKSLAEISLGGLRQQIPSTRQFVFNAAVKLGTDATNSFLDNVYKVFDFDSPAGDTRIAFCGNSALNALAKVAAATTNVRLNSDSIIKQYGMDPFVTKKEHHEKKPSVFKPPKPRAEEPPGLA